MSAEAHSIIYWLILLVIVIVVIIVLFKVLNIAFGIMPITLVDNEKILLQNIRLS